MKTILSCCLLACTVSTLLSCASSYKGTLVDARNFLNLHAAGDSPAQQHSAFYAMKANLPAAILMNNGKLVFLSNASSQLADYSSKTVKAQGPYLRREKILHATHFWVKTDAGWKKISIR